MRVSTVNRARSRRRPRLESLELRRLLAADGLSPAPDHLEVEQNATAIQIDVLENDLFDPDYAGQRVITGVSTASLGGRVDISEDGRSLSYLAPADASGIETFRYTVDGAASADVSIRIVTPLPEFRESIYLFQDQYKFDLIEHSNFTDGYAGEKRITLISETQDGADIEITEDGKSVIYRSRIGIEGQDQFTYIVDDRFVGTAMINVSNPLAWDEYEVVANSDATSLDVLANDFRGLSDPGFDLLSIRPFAKVTHVLGESDRFDLAISDDGRSVLFTPATDFAGRASFRYVVDSQFEEHVSVMVHRPVRSDRFDADVDGGVHTFDVLENDYYESIFSDAQIRVVDRVTSVTQGDQGGTVEVSGDGKRVLYTPADGFVGNETFEYVADEKQRASVTVTVTQPVRDDWYSVFQGTPTPLSVLDNDFAADQGDAAAAASITAIGESQVGATIVLDPSGVLIYTPPDDALQTDPVVWNDQFEYTVNDTYTANVTVRFDFIARADNIRVDHKREQTLNVLDNDHFSGQYPGPGRITSVTDPSQGGSVRISDDGKSLIYQPGGPFETFDYTVDDRFSTYVYASPNPWLKSDSAVADQNGPATDIFVKENDFKLSYQYYGSYDGARVITAVSEAEHGGTVEIVGNRVTYLPPTDFVGTDTFTYTIDDFLTSTVRVHVIRRAADDLVRVAPDSQANVLNVLANDILGADYTGAGLISDVSPSDAGATVQVAADGRSILYTAADGFVGQDRFVYTIDGQSKATVTVTVHDEVADFLSEFSSADQLRDYLLDLSVERYEQLFGKPGYVYAANRSASLESLDTAGGLDFSETNVQVAGVDEDDVVETDGNFIYALRGDELAIVKSFPADELELVSRTQIEGTPIGMYLQGDRVTVLSELVEFGGPYPYPEISRSSAAVDFAGGIFFPYPNPREVTTIVTVLDVADRSAPEVVQRTTIEGSFSDSRRIGDQVFLVLGSQDLLIEPELICDSEGNDCLYETEQEFVDRVQREFASILQELLPSYESFDGQGELVRSGPLVLPEDLFQSLENATQMTAVVSINMASHEAGLGATSGVLAQGGSTIYANAEHLYVFEPYRESLENEPWTRILRFDWDGLSGAVDFTALGEVPGSLLDQFSADEHDGLLRVTTEISNSGTGNHSFNEETALFVLRDDAGILEFVGRLQNLALGDNVKSVRYHGDSAMVTTFPTGAQRVDPLYGIDLSDPAHPRVQGHVPIPGFNSYMQFITPDRLLTVGINSATGWGGRAQVSLFDVSDLTNPKVIEQFNLPKFSRTEANLDHHAFGWFARHELLAVPIGRSFNDRFDDDGDGYPEAIRRVTEDALSMMHVGIDETTGEEGISWHGQIEHAASVLRSVYINDNIYSVGLDAIRTVSVDDPSVVVAEVVYPEDPVDPTGERVLIDLVPVGTAARQLLATRMAVDSQSLMVVAHETSDGLHDLVLRSGTSHYRYQGRDADSLTLVDDAFLFADQWHNKANPNDVNGDNAVTGADALGVINEIGRRQGGELPVDRVLRQINAVARYADTNGDGRITPVDALRVINQMGRDLEQTLAIEAEQLPAIALVGSAVDHVWSNDDDDDTPSLF